MKLRESERHALELEEMQANNRIRIFVADLCRIAIADNERLKEENAQLRLENMYLTKRIMHYVVSDERRNAGGSLTTADAPSFTAADGADEELG